MPADVNRRGEQATGKLALGRDICAEAEAERVAAAMAIDEGKTLGQAATLLQAFHDTNVSHERITQ